MIILPFMVFGNVIILALSALLSVIDWVMPDQFAEAMIYFLSMLGYFNGFIDMDTFFLCLGALGVFFSRWYLFKLSLLILNLIPGVNLDFGHMFGQGGHSHNNMDTVNLRNYPQGAIDLRGVKAGRGYRADYRGKKFYDIKGRR